ncbi:MAG: cytochrome c biogenesis protein CcsA [Planctomycetes bacterium]|nr:cytochrome c biogenesis protein CcsA [Planctomycetota bacterium]MCW8135201.1 cytochrome c biogenesis protein CcsA [Planctomycetota bacterium]
MLARIETIEQFESAVAIMRTGNAALYVALFMTIALAGLAGASAWRKDERLAHAARRGQYALFALTAFCCALLYVGIFEGYYFVNYIERVTENNEELTFKLAALWASQQGSLLFWCFILTGFGAAFAFSQRHNRTDRRLPFTLIALAVVQFFFFFIITSPTDVEAAQRSSPFSMMYEWMVMTITNKEAGTAVNHSAKTIFALLSDADSRAPQHGWELLRAMHASGHGEMTLRDLHAMVLNNPGKLPPEAQAVLLEQISDGNGMNPALHNYWVAIHPPMLYLGFVGFTIPFCYAVGSLLSGEVGEGWLKPIRLWVMASWGFLTVGIALGGLWAYEILGWGGYWAWDPVENASLIPWLTGTAFIHSVIVTERRGMLRMWSFALIVITYCMTVVGTFLVRSGIINSVHAFGATGDVDTWFYGFMLVVFMGPLLLLIWRKPLLAPDRQLESLWSREGSFLFNNLIFLAIGLVTLIITGWPLITETLYGDTGKQELGQDAYVMINIPLLLIVLVLMGIGPALAWQRNSLRQSLRLFAAPLIAAGVMALINGLWLAGNDLLIDVDKGDRIGTAAAVVRLVVQLTLWPICVFTLVCILMEFAAGARARARSTGEGFVAALFKVSLANRRRYGGYIVHVGVLLVALGIYYSSFYESEGTVIAQPGGYGVIENRLTGDKLLVVYEANQRSESWDFMKEAFGDEERAQLYANMLRYVRMNPGLSAEQIVDTVVRDYKAQMGGELPPQMQQALPRMQAAIAWGIEQRKRQVVYETFETTLQVYPYKAAEVDTTRYRRAQDSLFEVMANRDASNEQFGAAVTEQGDEAVLLGAELPATHRALRQEYAQLDAAAFALRFGIDPGARDFGAQRFAAMQQLERLHEMIEGYAVTRRNEIVAELAHKLPDERAAQTLASMRPLTLGGLHRALAETHPEKAQHIRAEIDATTAGAATVTPRMRIFYDKRTGVPRTAEALKDPQYHRTPGRDAYFILQDTRQDGTATFRFFVKPQMTLGLAGLAVIIAGTVMAFLPSVRRRRKAVAP